MVPDQAVRSTMRYQITAEAGYLRAELFNRETVEETRAFLRAVVRENAKHRRPCVLILVRVSKPIFQVVPHRLIEYIELLARQRRLNVRSFRDEPAALQWLKDQRKAEDRRQRSDRREQERRASPVIPQPAG